jgi:hypothetical protein
VCNPEPLKCFLFVCMYVLLCSNSIPHFTTKSSLTAYCCQTESYRSTFYAATAILLVYFHKTYFIEPLLSYTRAGKNNGKTTNTVHISLLTRCCTNFAFNTATVLLGMDSYKFWTASGSIIYHSYWRTSSSCFRVVGGVNPFLILVSKTD